ncbi:FkbM family methyltransferase [Salinibacter ruber]|uniref:FkbM family methyltransferase n=1 Tax=Salinibacter ruber TaxID=146919 RepID=UPI0021676B7D|nr:FkbM family methyltransferase [Salinibacter ruber]MCS4177387.1 FkbM family methyltransferase [Salinibacter ruber]
MKFAKKAISTLRKEGTQRLIEKTTNYLKSKLKNVKKSLFVKYYIFYGSYEGSVELKLKRYRVEFSTDSASSVEGTIRRFLDEKHEIMGILDCLKEDDTFYDIGANTGMYSLFASEKCSRVIAFEPYPPNIKKLKKNVRINDSSNVVRIVEAALSDKSGKTGFLTVESENSKYPGVGSPGFGRGTVTDENSDLQVPTIRGDELVEQNAVPYPNVVKIDVEGSEPLVLDGLANALSSDLCRTIYCEVHLSKKTRGSIHDYGLSEEDLFAKLYRIGFSKVEKITEEERKFLLKATK